MARTRRCIRKQGGQRTRRQIRLVGGKTIGKTIMIKKKRGLDYLDYLLFGNMTAEGKPTAEGNPLTLAKPSGAADAGKPQDTMDPFRKQIKQRYAGESAEVINTVIENVNNVREDLKSVKTMPELMAEMHNKFDSLMNNLSKISKSLEEDSLKDLTALILLFSSDAVMSALEAEAEEKKQQEAEAKAAKEQVPAAGQEEAKEKEGAAKEKEGAAAAAEGAGLEL